MSDPREERQPELPVLGSSPTTPVPSPSRRVAPGQTGTPAKPVVAVLGDVRRAGPWPVPETLTAVGVMGDVRLDLREAVLPGTPVEIHSYNLMSDLVVIVRPGTRVRLEGVNIMGTQRVYEPSTGHGHVQDAVLDVTIRAHGLMGDAKVHVLEPGEQVPSWWRTKKG